MAEEVEQPFDAAPEEVVAEARLKFGPSRATKI